jgi:hypothetical protein
MPYHGGLGYEADDLRFTAAVRTDERIDFPYLLDDSLQVQGSQRIARRILFMYRNSYQIGLK